MSVRTVRRLRLLRQPDLTLGNVMERVAEVHTDAELVRQDEPSLDLSFRQAAIRVREWSGAVRLQVGPGERIVLALPNSYELLLACFAVAHAGAVAVPVNAQMRPDEIDHVIADSGAQLVVRSVDELTDPGIVPKEAMPADPGDVAALFYTSGTTGKPKGVALTHRSLVDQARRLALWPAELRRDSAVVALPVAHIMGFVVLLGFAAGGITTRFLPRFRPDDVLDAIETERASIFIGVPAMYRMLLQAGAEYRDLNSIRVWGSGADAMPTDLAQRFKEMGAMISVPGLGPVGQASFVEGYGMVEAGGGVAAKISPPYLAAGLGDGVGLRLPGYRFRVMDEDDRRIRRWGEVGELHVRGPGLLREYWNSPDATERALTGDGWLRTGDLVRLGPLGSVLFAGRKKDVIKHGGYSVYAVEVEQTLEACPVVVEAAVVGLPDERLGEVPVAFVRLVEPKKARTKAATAKAVKTVLAFAEEHLAEYKRPAEVHVVDELPRTGTTKVQKQSLRDGLAGG